MKSKSLVVVAILIAGIAVLAYVQRSGSADQALNEATEGQPQQSGNREPGNEPRSVEALSPASNASEAGTSHAPAVHREDLSRDSQEDVTLELDEAYSREELLNGYLRYVANDEPLEAEEALHAALFLQECSEAYSFTVDDAAMSEACDQTQADGDREEILALLELAADSGLPDAHYQMSAYFSEEDERFEHHLVSAAEKGSNTAAVALMNFYRREEFHDPARAYFWARVAASNEVYHAQVILPEFEKTLTRAEYYEGQALLRDSDLD